MLYALKLLLPVVIPSWNFFDVIVPSPRIQFAVIETDDENNVTWQEFRPCIKRLSFRRMLGRMFWNAQWNESLFMMSCSERLMDYPTQHSENEIFKRLISDVRSSGKEYEGKLIKFRLVFVRRESNELVEEIHYQSESRLIKKSI